MAVLGTERAVGVDTGIRKRMCNSYQNYGEDYHYFMYLWGYVIWFCNWAGVFFIITQFCSNFTYT